MLYYCSRRLFCFFLALVTASISIQHKGNEELQPWFRASRFIIAFLIS